MRLCLLALAVLVSSCTGNGPGDLVKAPMEIAMDSGGGRMFYKGTVAIPRGFHSREAFDLDVHLTSWGSAPANEVGVDAAKLLKENHKKKGRYQPLGNGEGEILLARGRLQLRGVIVDNGQELDGDWFLDGRHGGGFRIVRQGHLFPE